MGEEIKRDKRRRAEPNRNLSTDTRSLNHASSTSLKGNFHDHAQEVIDLKAFKTLYWFKEEVSASLRAKPNKSPGRDGVHYEMLKVDIQLMTDLIVETSKLISHSRR